MIIKATKDEARLNPGIWTPVPSNGGRSTFISHISPNLTPYKAYWSDYTQAEDYNWMWEVLDDQTDGNDKVFVWHGSHGGLIYHDPIFGPTWKYGLIFGKSWWEPIFLGEIWYDVLWGQDHSKAYWGSVEENVESIILEGTEVFYWMSNCRGEKIYNQATSDGDFYNFLGWYSHPDANSYMFDHLDAISETLEFEAFEQYESSRSLDGSPSIYDAVEDAFEALSDSDFYEADYNTIDFWL